jgi:hypothetical protein
LDPTNLVLMAEHAAVAHWAAVRALEAELEERAADKASPAARPERDFAEDPEERARVQDRDFLEVSRANREDRSLQEVPADSRRQGSLVSNPGNLRASLFQDPDLMAACPDRQGRDPADFKGAPDRGSPAHPANHRGRDLVLGPDLADSKMEAREWALAGLEDPGPRSLSS